MDPALHNPAVHGSINCTIIEEIELVCSKEWQEEPGKESCQSHPGRVRPRPNRGFSDCLAQRSEPHNSIVRVSRRYVGGEGRAR
jgi:hypothetical protein